MKSMRTLSLYPAVKKLTVGLLSALGLLIAAIPAIAQTYSVVYNFGTNTGDPLAPIYESMVSQGRDGNLYGTTRSGGANAYGAAFKITPAGALTVEYNFKSQPDPAVWPVGGLVLGTDGNLYGTASYGGLNGAGTLFKLTPTGTLTVLYDFGGAGLPGHPYSAPILGTDGNLYGTLIDGGPSGCTYLNGGCGAVYKITPSGTLTILHQFLGPEGGNPYAPLVLGTDGNFYGTTAAGGTIGTSFANLGTVFKITPAGKFTSLYSFDSTHGYAPLGPVVQGSDGNFYGTTEYGGAGLLGEGVIYKITPAGSFSVLYNFCSVAACADGGNSVSGMVLATDGNFYGTATKGGANKFGVIYKITPQGTFSVLYNFDATTGAYPENTLVQHTNGTLYGNTYQGGSTNFGVFFSLKIGQKPFVSTVLSSGKVGQPVQILGQGFNSATSVSFNGLPVVFSVKSDTFMTTTVPTGATTGFITVTTGTGTLKSNKKFRVTPQLTSFAPSSGPVGTSVVITGNSLTQTSKVTIGGVNATFTVNSDTQVTATVPATAVTGKIAITTAGGTVTSAGNFTVTPAITSFTPPSGKVGTLVTLTGTTFKGTTSVTFGGVSAAFTVETSTQVAATVPPGAVTGKIQITTPAGTGSSATNFTVTP